MTNVTRSKRIRAVLVEDHLVVANALKQLFDAGEAIDVVEVCSRGEDVTDVVRRVVPDIVIMDLQLDGSQVDGVEAAHRIRASNADTKILVLTSHTDPSYFFRTLNIGIDGYILKHASPEQVEKAIQSVVAGDFVIHQQVMDMLRGHLAPPKDDVQFLRITDREWDVLELIGDDCSNSEIAEILNLEVSTIKGYVRTISEKLAIKGRQLIAVWYQVYGRSFRPK